MAELCKWDIPRSNRERPRPTAAFKAITAAVGVLGLVDGRDPAAIAAWMRSELMRQWTMINALQYITGKEARAALETLPPDFAYSGISLDGLKLACVHAAGLLVELDRHRERLSSTIELVQLFHDHRSSGTVPEELRTALRRLFPEAG